MKKYKIKHKFEFTSIIALYAQWIREGKLKVNSDWNKDLKIKFTCQDPCNTVRKTWGQRMADDMRFVIKTVVGEENFIDMIPSGVNNYCCGGGGGALQGGFPEQRRAFGKVKFDQVIATGAKYVLAPCHNCHSQIMDLNAHYGGNFYVAHIWTFICLAMGMLAENERAYMAPEHLHIGL